MTTTICLAVLSLALLGFGIYQTRILFQMTASESKRSEARDMLRGQEQQKLVETLCSSFFATTPRSTNEESVSPESAALTPAWEGWNPEELLEEQDQYAMGPWQTNGQAQKRIQEGLATNDLELD